MTGHLRTLKHWTKDLALLSSEVWFFEPFGGTGNGWSIARMCDLELMANSCKVATAVNLNPSGTERWGVIHLKCATHDFWSMHRIRDTGATGPACPRIAVDPFDRGNLISLFPRFAAPTPPQVDYEQLVGGNELEWVGAFPLPTVSKIPQMIYSDVVRAFNEYAHGFIVVQTSEVESSVSAKLQMYGTTTDPDTITFQDTETMSRISAIDAADWGDDHIAWLWWYGADSVSGKELGTLEVAGEESLLGESGAFDDILEPDGFDVQLVGEVEMPITLTR